MWGKASGLQLPQRPQPIPEEAGGMVGQRIPGPSAVEHRDFLRLVVV